jgi:hypothetical protein
MAQILEYARHKLVLVEKVPLDGFRSSTHLLDNHKELWVELVITPPELNIEDARGRLVSRVDGPNEIPIDGFLSGVRGLRVGPGIKKQIQERLKGAPFERCLRSALEECINGVILTFTKEVLKGAPKDPEGEKRHFQEMVKNNPRLYNSCAALSKDSPLMEGLRMDGNDG